MEEKHGRIGSLDGGRAERGSHEPTPAAKRRIAVDRSPERVPARSMEGLPREERATSRTAEPNVNTAAFEGRSAVHLSFMTWVVPDWDLDRILEYAADSVYDGVEFRVQAERHLMDPGRVEGGHDHGVSAALSTAERREIRDRCERHGVDVPCIATGDEMGHVEPDERADHLASAKANIELAGDLGAPYVRVFCGGGREELDDEVADACAAGFDELGEFGRDHGVTPLLATHDVLSDPMDALAVLERIGTDNVGLLYNYDRIDRETADALGDRIRHVHVHEDVLDAEYEGIADLQRELHGFDYDGYFSLEVIRGENLSVEELDRAGENMRRHVESITDAA